MVWVDSTLNGLGFPNPNLDPQIIKLKDKVAELAVNRKKLESIISEIYEMKGTSDNEFTLAIKNDLEGKLIKLTLETDKIEQDILFASMRARGLNK